jgi:predicted RNase H-like nuclease (RuvC/YqgF family)
MDPVEVNQSSYLTEKTQKLLETASTISETLAKLDRPILLEKEHKETTTEMKITTLVDNSDSKLQETKTNVFTGIPIQEKPISPVEPKTPTVQTSEPVFTGSTTFGTSAQYLDRIQQLEVSLSQSQTNSQKQAREIASLGAKVESLRNQNHELSMKSTRHANELKAVMEQNDILRQENRRHVEVEAQLRAKLLAMSQPVEPEVTIDPSTKVLQERTSQRALDLIGKLTFEIQRDKKYGRKVLEAFRDSLEISLKLVRTQSTNPTPKQIIHECNEMVILLENGLESGVKSFQDMNDLDCRIDRLIKENGEVNQGYQRTIHQLQEQLEGAKMEIETQGKKWSAKCDALTEKYKQVVLENEELIALQREVVLQNQELEKIAAKPEPIPEVVVMNQGENDIFKKEKELYLEKIRELEAYIDSLQATIERWKNENSILQNESQKLSGQRKDLESQLVRKEQIINELEEFIEDERLKNDKAAELIKQLQSQTPGVYEGELPGDITKLEELLESQVQAFERIGLENGDQETSQLRVLQYMKNYDETSNQVSKLQIQISGIFYFIRSEKGDEQVGKREQKVKDQAH